MWSSLDEFFPMATREFPGGILPHDIARLVFKKHVASATVVVSDFEPAHDEALTVNATKYLNASEGEWNNRLLRKRVVKRVSLRSKNDALSTLVTTATRCNSLSASCCTTASAVAICHSLTFLVSLEHRRDFHLLLQRNRYR